MRTSVTEALALAAVLASVVQHALWPGETVLAWPLAGLAVGLLLAAVAINPARWQLIPAGLAWLIVLAWTLAPGTGGALAAGAAALLLAISAALACGLPAGGLPRPKGGRKVGVAAGELVRPGASPDAGRALTVKIWYPAAPGKTARRSLEPFWSELLELQEIPGLARALLAYLKRVSSHAAVGAAPALEDAPHPLLIYNHSLVSFASENTLLMEQLASSGYVVLSVRHQGQAAEQAQVQAGVSEQERALDRKLQSGLKRASSRKERAGLSLQLFANSTGTSAIVQRRAEDSAFVLDHLEQVLSAIPGGAALVAKAGGFGALGLSLGGAVATRLALFDRRCLGVANLDGGLYGVDPEQPLPGPYLMVYSQDNAGTNDGFRRPEKGFHEQVLAGARHLDLHDAAAVFPGLRWLGLLGPAGRARSRRLRRTVTAFFDAAMRRSPAQSPW
jgi:hypothetical protein